MTTLRWLAGLAVWGMLTACTKRAPTDKAAVAQAARQPVDSVSTPAIREYRAGTAKIRVVYQSAEIITATRIAGQDSVKVTLRGDFQPDPVLGCDSCLLINSKGVFSQTSGYAVGDSLFLLTVAGANWRALLFGIDFKTKTLLETSGALGNDHLETYLAAFAYNDERRQVTASDSFSGYADNLELTKVTLHTYGIGRNKFSHKRQVVKAAPPDLSENPAAAMPLLRQLAR